MKSNQVYSFQKEEDGEKYFDIVELCSDIVLRLAYEHYEIVDSEEQMQLRNCAMIILNDARKNRYNKFTRLTNPLNISMAIMCRALELYLGWGEGNFNGGLSQSARC